MGRADKFLTRTASDGGREVWAVRVDDGTYPIAGGDGKAEAERKANEAHRVDNENARLTSEQQRIGSEGERAEAEKARVSAEQARAQAEATRAEAEGARKQGEAKRVDAESKRAQAETARATAETARADAEASRSRAETERAGAESARKQAETARAEAERGRSEAEKARVSAEQARARAQAKNDADQALNNEQMKRLSPVILAEGQYDRATLKPTVEGEPNRVYFVPMVAPAAIELFGLSKSEVQAGNSYVEWMWVGGKWEQMGQSEMRAKPITTDQIDAVFSGGHPTGDDVLSLTGLDYVRTKDAALLDGKAAASHKHAKTDVTGLEELVREAVSRAKLEAHPVGSYYFSDSAADPSSLFGGVWERVEGRFLFAADGAHAPGSLGGAAEVSLAVGNMPAHSHGVTVSDGGAHSHGASTGWAGDHSHSASSGAAGSHTHVIGVDFDGAGGGSWTAPHKAGADGARHHSPTGWAGEHSHSVSVSSAGGHSHTVSVESGGGHSHTASCSSVGGGSAHQNMPPYIAVYCWKRTA